MMYISLKFCKGCEALIESLKNEIKGIIRIIIEDFKVLKM